MFAQVVGDPQPLDIVSALASKGEDGAVAARVGERSGIAVDMLADRKSDPLQIANDHLTLVVEMRNGLTGGELRGPERHRASKGRGGSGGSKGQGGKSHGDTLHDGHSPPLRYEHWKLEAGGTTLTPLFGGVQPPASGRNVLT